MRLLFVCFFALVSSFCFGQFNNNSYQQNENTLLNLARPATPTLFGGIRAKFVNAGVYADTTAANLDNAIKFYNGATIVTYSGSVKQWVRYNLKWWEISGGGGSMIYPPAGIAVSTGSAWGASINGSSSQFVKGDGSLDGNTYATQPALVDTAAAIRADFPTGLGVLDTLPSPLFNVVQSSAGTNYKSHARKVFHASDYGARGDGIKLLDGAIANGDNTFTSASSNFTSADIGKSIVVYGAGGSGQDLRTTIASINSPTSVELTAAASATVSSAKAKYGTNNTKPIQDAINAAFANHGGRVVIPYGRLYVFDTLNTSAGQNPRAQIYIPLSPYTSSRTDTLASYEIVGEVPPNTFSEALDDKYTAATGTLVESTRRHDGAVFGAEAESQFWGIFNFARVHFQDINVRTDTDSSNVLAGNRGTGIDASRMAMVSGTRVAVSTENVYTSVLPKETSFGIKTPPANNWAVSKWDDIHVSGYYTGITIGEHTQIDGILIDVCYDGLVFTTAGHSAHINKGTIHRSVNMIRIAGAAHFSIDNIALEVKSNTANPIGAWFTTQYVLKEDAGGSTGFINYNITESGVGWLLSKQFELFTRTNAANSFIVCKPIHVTNPVTIDGSIPGYNLGNIWFNKLGNHFEAWDITGITTNRLILDGHIRTNGSTKVFGGNDEEVLYRKNGAVGRDVGLLFNDADRKLTIYGSANSALGVGEVANASLGTIMGSVVASGSMGGRITARNGSSTAVGNSTSFSTKNASDFTGAYFSSQIITRTGSGGVADQIMDTYLYDGGSPGGTLKTTLLSNGNFGIGVPSPSEKLEVNGNIKALAPTYSSGGYDVLVRNQTSGRYEKINNSTNAGTYTPTLFNTTNVSASTAYTCKWSRVDSVYTISGEIDIDPTSASTLTVLGISLPSVITGSISNTFNISGTAADDLGTVARIRGDITNGRIEVRMTPTDVTNRRFSFICHLIADAP